MVRHVHGVAPFDIFPRAHATFSRITIGTGREILVERNEKLLSLSIYISFLETSTKRQFTVEHCQALENGTNKRSKKKKRRRRLNCLGGK